VCHGSKQGGRGGDAARKGRDCMNSIGKEQRGTGRAGRSRRVKRERQAGRGKWGDDSMGLRRGASSESRGSKPTC